MKAQLFCGLLVPAMLAGACQRPAGDARQRAGDTAADLKSRAAEARERFTDAWITTQIQSKFVGDREIHARDIGVSTRGGVVTLSGRVLNEPLRQLAVVLAKNTDGVTQVVDQLEVQVAPPVAKRPSPAGTTGAVATSGTSETSAAPTSAAPQSPDADIMSAIQSKYFLDDHIKGRHIEVSSSGGVVTLNGEVADDTERARALLVARTTEGVTRVEDHLTVAAPDGAGAPASDVELVARLRTQLSSDEQVRGAPIEVTASNGVVRLQGTVPNAAAKQRALTLARSTEGVTQIVDQIHVGAAKR